MLWLSFLFLEDLIFSLQLKKFHSNKKYKGMVKLFEIDQTIFILQLFTGFYNYSNRNLSHENNLRN